MDDRGRIDFELGIAAGDTRARVAPNRGGMVTHLAVSGRALLFMDDASFRDPSKNVRGGSPVLFPTPGKLAGDAWSRDGHQGSLGQHGFARNRAWSVVEARADSVMLRLEADDATRATYPWDFRVDLTHRVEAGVLFTDVRVENHSSTPMPFGFGFHPYFVVTDKRAFTLESDATRALDNVTKTDVAFDARTLDLTRGEVDLHLLDHAHRTLAFAPDPSTRVTLDGGCERPHWVLWSLPGRDFVCIEPWTCPGNAMNTGDRLRYVPPGARDELSFAYRIEIHTR